MEYSIDDYDILPEVLVSFDHVSGTEAMIIFACNDPALASPTFYDLKMKVRFIGDDYVNYDPLPSNYIF